MDLNTLNSTYMFDRMLKSDCTTSCYEFTRYCRSENPDTNFHC